jgi:hypothetical protein
LIINDLQKLPLASSVPTCGWHGFCYTCAHVKLFFEKKSLLKVKKVLALCSISEYYLLNMKTETELYNEIISLRTKLVNLKIALEHCRSIAKVYGDGTCSSVGVSDHGFDKIKETVNEVLTSTQV